MDVKSNIWLEIDGVVVLSAWRIKLLKAVQETGSISQAANLMDVPYRRAWEKIHQAEAQLDYKLIETQIGGSGGGGAQLTAECMDLITKYATLTEGIRSLLKQRFDDIFDD